MFIVKEIEANHNKVKEATESMRPRQLMQGRC